jgi:hypothetical protein
MRGLVDDAAVGRDVPEPAEIRLPLETIERNSPRFEIFGDGEARRAGADDAIFNVASKIGHERNTLGA